MTDAIDIDNKVEADYTMPGFVTEMRLHEGRHIAKVRFPDGFENWYPVSALKKLEYKERYVNHYD